MGLRPYQQTIINEIYEAHKVHKSVMLQLCTGGGKTQIFSHIAKQYIDNGERVLIMVHRKELVEQAANKLIQIGLNPAIIMPGHEFRPFNPLQVSSIQTLKNKAFHESIEFGLVIIDEAHHCTAETYKLMLKRYGKHKILGVTATPCRLNGTGFKDQFDYLVKGPSVNDLIKENYLTPTKIYWKPTGIDFKKIKKSRGDYNERELAEEMCKSKLVGDVVKTYIDYAKGLSCVLFAVNCEHSQMICKRFNENGIRAEHVDATISKNERTAILQRYRNRETQVLCNVDIVSEGFDLDLIECVSLCRPTKSLALFLQQIGRGLRIMDGKENCIVLDHANNIIEHGLPDSERVWSLDGVSKADSLILKKHKAGGTELIERESEPMIFEEAVELEQLSRNIEYLLPDGFVTIFSKIEEQINRNIPIKRLAAYYEFRRRFPDFKLSLWQLREIGRICGVKDGWWYYIARDDFGYSEYQIKKFRSFFKRKR